MSSASFDFSPLPHVPGLRAAAAPDPGGSDPGSEPGTGEKSREGRRRRPRSSRPRFSAAIGRPRLISVFRGIRVPALVGLHGLAFAAIYLMAFWIRFDGSIPAAVRASAVAALPLVVAIKMTAFLAMRCHRGWWRSATFADLTGLAEASAFGSAAVFLAGAALGGEGWSSRSVLLIDGVGTATALCGARGAARLLRDRYAPLVASRRLKRVLVVGAGEAGEEIVRQIAAKPRMGMKVVGLLDPERALHGRILAGVPVLGDPRHLGRIAARCRADAVLIPTPTVAARQVRALSLACGEAGLTPMVVPGFDALLSGALTVQPREVDIQDLLSREPVRLDGEAIGRFLKGRVVVVTGAAGSIGSEICRQILAFRPDRLILIDHAENGLFHLRRGLADLIPEETEVVCYIASITDGARIRALFARHRPHVVFHAAAHKHVPMMEDNPGEAVKNNVFGTRVVVDEALRSGVESFVMISTDKAVNPTSIMGVCKRLAETYMQSLSGLTTTRLITVRFGNVLDSAGSVVPIFRDQIRRGGPITVTHPDMTRYFMTIPEASQLVLQAGTLGSGGEIFVLDMGEPVRILDLAKEMIRLSGQVEGRDIDIEFTGTRPGEKLYEELYDDGEELLATAHPKIRAARYCPYSPEQLYDGLDRLASAVEGPAEGVVAILADLVPGYRPGSAVARMMATGAKSADCDLASGEDSGSGSVEIVRHPGAYLGKGNAEGSMSLAV